MIPKDVIKNLLHEIICAIDSSEYEISIKEIEDQIEGNTLMEFLSKNVSICQLTSDECEEINTKLKSIDTRLGETLFVKDSSIKSDGGVIEVLDRNSNWRVVLVSEAKFQGKDVENIQKGVLVGKNSDQDLMVAGNAIERVYKNSVLNIKRKKVQFRH